MEELALVPLLAQPPQPVFAHHCLLTTNVAKRAHAPCGGREKDVAMSPGAPGLGESRRLLPTLP